MSPLVGSKAPEFKLQGVLNGQFAEHALPHIDGKWTVLLFYPLDFTFVCPTEIIAYSKAAKEFEKLNTQVYGVSVDSHFTHLAWTETTEKQGGVGNIAYPLLSDINKEVAEAYGILQDGFKVALRGLFIIDEEGVVQHATINNLAVGREPSETLRLIQAFQHTKVSGEVCPAGWKPGDDTMRPDPEGLKEYAASHN